MKNGRITAVYNRMKKDAYWINNINEIVDLLLSFENATIKTHFLISQLYIRAGLGKRALKHLNSVKSDISSSKLDGSDKDIEDLNIAINLCEDAVNNNSKLNTIANILHEDFCL